VSFEQYLLTRVRGSMIDELRRQATLTRGAMRRRKAYNDAAATLTARIGRAPSEAELAESDLRAALVSAIGALPEREAQVVQLYYVEELNLEEIGLVLGVGAARVCQIKASAHARLKKALARKLG
jgi:RNA polymerase sigma factor for flagellar operon FliA